MNKNLVKIAITAGIVWAGIAATPQVQRVSAAEYLSGAQAPAVYSVQYSAEAEDPVGEVKNGFVEEDGGTRYYVEGVAVKGVRVIDDAKYFFDYSSGFMTRNSFAVIGNSRYYFGDDGKIYRCGLYEIDGEYYFMQGDCSVFNKGWKSISGSKYYFGGDGKAYRGLIDTRNNYKYCFDDEGRLQTDCVYRSGDLVFYADSNGRTIRGVRKTTDGIYHFNYSGKITISRWVTENGKKYYFGRDGKAYTGLISTANRYKYVFDENGVLQVNKLFTIRDMTVYADENGRTVSGVRKIGGSIYCFSTAGKMIKNAWQTVGGKTYFLGSDGKAYTGARKVKGSANYFYFGDQGYLTSGFVHIGAYYYRFKDNGRPYSGLYTSADGNKYYYRANGSLVKGAYKLNGTIYLFCGPSGALIKNEGWVNYSGKTYYAKSNGEATIGYKKLANYYYYFSSDGHRLQNTWAYANGYKFYFGSDGKRAEDVSSKMPAGTTYVIKVYKGSNTVTAYAKDGSKGYIIPVRTMICSTGNDTPTGEFHTPNKFRWLELMGPCWGQWDTQIMGNYLFHSVYYLSKNDNNTLSVSAYNKLGTTCSHGCIRLTSGDAKWIYDNCVLGTTVIITAKAEKGPFDKPTAYKLASWHTWDPTDPNMYYKCKQRGCH